MKWSLFFAYLTVFFLLVLYFLRIEGTGAFLLMLSLGNIVSVSLFSYYTGYLAFLLGKSWVLWGFGSMFASPLGGIFIYRKVRKLSREKGWWSSDLM